jgi:hypothetical protein
MLWISPTQVKNKQVLQKIKTMDISPRKNMDISHRKAKISQTIGENCTTSENMEYKTPINIYSMDRVKGNKNKSYRKSWIFFAIKYRGVTANVLVIQFWGT